jgi:hypothetical protein
MRGRVGCACKHLSRSAAVIEMPDILLIDLPLSVDSMPLMFLTKTVQIHSNGGFDD